MTRFAAPRAALLPAFQDSAAADLSRALADGGPELEALIIRQQLAPLWHARTKANVFAKSRVNAALLYMRQVAALRELDDLFSQRGIRYAVVKGTATRELTFDDPSLRLCSDIDILVAPGQRVEAAHTLVASGYLLRPDPSVISHEVMLSKGPGTIDLHWDILRPARTRMPVTDGLLARRQRHDGWWTLSDGDALFLMLVHGAICRHVSMSGMGLHRVADIALWWQRCDVDWATVHRQLEAAGLKTAAWAVLTWVRMLSPATFGPVVDAAIRSLRPSRLRAAYLTSWLSQDLSARLERLHAVRLLGFSALLHDQPSDAWHALRGWHSSKTTAETDVLVFEGLIE